MNLQLELNRNHCDDPSDGSAVMLTPPIDEDFWLARVPVGGGQSIVCFPKFGTIGIGFAKERDWNTNLPYSCRATDIYDHIRHNRGRCRASDEECVRAIDMLREFATGLPGPKPITEVPR